MDSPHNKANINCIQHSLMWSEDDSLHRTKYKPVPTDHFQVVFQLQF